MIFVDFASKWVLIRLLDEKNTFYNAKEASLSTIFWVSFSSLFLIWQLHYRIILFALSFILGGVSANILDRVLFGPVFDFIKLPFLDQGYLYNLADMFIFFGIFVMAFSLLTILIKKLMRHFFGNSLQDQK